MVRCYNKVIVRGDRCLAYAESTDWVHWTEPEIVFHARETGEEGADFYGMTVTPYEGMYIGLLWNYRKKTTNTIDVELATSRDGVRWRHCSDRTPYLAAPGGRKTWDASMVLTPDHFLVVGDEIRIYYGATQGPHNSTWPPSGIGLATCKLDRFAAVHASAGTGSLLTKPLLLAGDWLTVNVHAPTGSLRVEATDSTGKPIPGYEAAACRALTGDHLAAPVTWQGSASLRKLAGRPVRLRLVLEGDAEVFSFAVGP